MIIVRRPSAQRSQNLLDDQRDAPLTYAHAGGTRDDPMPAGYVHDRYEIDLGTGEAAFAKACDGLRQWACHAGARIAVYPETPELKTGNVLVMSLPARGFWVLAACRIVYVIDEANRFGFAYGTLPAHPEEGEEAFMVERGDDDRVVLRIIVFSKPRDLLARLGRRSGRRLQVATTKRFLRGLRDFVAT